MALSSFKHNPRVVTAAMALLILSQLGPAGCAAQAPAPAGGEAATAPLSAQRIAELLASPDRSEADRTNDLRRKPDRLLAFIGVRPGMRALDVSAGGGYTTELLARAAGPDGRVYGQTAPRKAVRTAAEPEGAASPAGAPAPATAPAASAATAAPTGLAARAARLGAGRIVAVVQPFENPVPAEVAAGTLDLVTLMFNYHDLGHLGVDRERMNRALHAALKPGGFYVIADHAGRPGTGISEAGTLHRIEESFLRREVEAAGFRLLQEGDFLRNPGDPRDRNTPSPPQPKDDFVLKFVKD
jgi:predicted methyltransferase